MALSGRIPGHFPCSVRLSTRNYFTRDFGLAQIRRGLRVRASQKRTVQTLARRPTLWLPSSKLPIGNKPLPCSHGHPRGQGTALPITVSPPDIAVRRKLGSVSVDNPYSNHCNRNPQAPATVHRHHGPLPLACSLPRLLYLPHGPDRQ